MRKRILHSLAICVIVLAMLLSTVSVYADTYSFYVTPTSTTAIYRDANTNSYSFGTVSPGDVMGVKYTSGDYYYVYVGGQYGYVLKSYCTQTTSTTITQPSQSISKYLNTITATILYSQPYTYSSSLASIPAGSYVAIINSSGEFYYVYYNNQYGYIPVSAFSGSITGSYTVTALSSVAMYSTAGSGGNMIALIPAGANVTVNSTNGAYYYLTYGNNSGYALMSSFTGGAGSNVFSTSTYTGSTTSTTPISNADGVVAYGTVTAGAALLKTPGGVATATFPSGGQIGIISKTSSGYFYVSANGTKGYVAAASLSTSSTNIPISDTSASISTSPAPSGGKSATIGNCKKNVNMRSEASSSSTLLGAVPKGASITAYKKSGSYTQISYNGTTGYVLSKYVKK